MNTVSVMTSLGGLTAFVLTDELSYRLPLTKAQAKALHTALTQVLVKQYDYAEIPI